MGSESMAEWAIDSDAMRTRGTIFLVKSKCLVRNIEKKTTLATTVLVFKASAFRY